MYMYTNYGKLLRLICCLPSECFNIVLIIWHPFSAKDYSSNGEIKHKSSVLSEETQVILNVHKKCVVYSEQDAIQKTSDFTKIPFQRVSKIVKKLHT